MATHSSILAWRIPWTELSCRLLSGHKELDMTEWLTLSLSWCFQLLLCLSFHEQSVLSSAFFWSLVFKSHFLFQPLILHPSVTCLPPFGFHLNQSAEVFWEVTRSPSCHIWWPFLFSLPKHVTLSSSPLSSALLSAFPKQSSLGSLCVCFSDHPFLLTTLLFLSSECPLEPGLLAHFFTYSPGEHITSMASVNLRVVDWKIRLSSSDVGLFPSRVWRC